MTRALALFALVVAVAACAPAASPSYERLNGDVRVTVRANDTLYDATLSLVNAESDDERCFEINETDAACVLGTIPEGQETYVLAERNAEFSCVVYAYTAMGDLTSYRPYRCPVPPAEGGGGR